MEYEQALSIGKRRRTDAMYALTRYLNERATEVCAVRPAKGCGISGRDWEPVGEENFKEICIRTGPTGDKEAYLVVVDRDGVAKACTQRTYPLRIALQMARGIPLPIYTGRGGTLIAEVQEESMRRLQPEPQLPEL